MQEQHPQVADLDAILGRARAKILQGIAIEPQLAEGERSQARLIVHGALTELIAGVSGWMEQYRTAGMMVTGGQADELQRLFDAADEREVDE